MSSAERLYAVVVREIGHELSRDAFTLIPVDALDLDSLSLLDLFLQIENEFDVKIPDMTALATFGDVLAFVENHAA